MEGGSIYYLSGMVCTAISLLMMVFLALMHYCEFRGILDLQMKSVACAFYTTPLTGSPLILSCAGSNMASPCTARFCNRLCFTRSAKLHPLLCPTKNPASIPLIQFVRESRWMAFYALVLCTSRLLLESQSEDKSSNDNWEMIHALAELGMEERHKYSYNL